MAVGKAFQTAGSLIGGLAGFQAGKANAAAAKAEANAALRRGVAQEDAVRMDARRTAGEALAAMGASGGAMGTGSAADVLRDIELTSGLDRLRARTGAQTEYGSKMAESRFAKRSGSWALLSGVANAGSNAFGPKGG